MDFKRYNPNYLSSEIYKYRPIFNFKPILEDFIPLVYNFPYPTFLKVLRKGNFGLV